jgi:hypothetical protein
MQRKIAELNTFPNGDTSCWSAATLSPILSFFSFGDTGDVLGLVFLGFFGVMLPNSSELVVTTAFPLK